MATAALENLRRPLVLRTSSLPVVR